MSEVKPLFSEYFDQENNGNATDVPGNNFRSEKSRSLEVIILYKEATSCYKRDKKNSRCFFINITRNGMKSKYIANAVPFSPYSTVTTWVMMEKQTKSRET
jgi:hypothetical protein